jgi:type II secretory pathway component PulF
VVRDYQFTGVGEDGRPQQGAIRAADRRSAIQALAQRQVFVTQIGEREAAGAVSPLAAAPSSGGGPRRVGVRAVAMLWRQLATALEAGLPLLVALQAVHEQADRPAIRELAQRLAERVQGGSSLSESLAQEPRTFAAMHISMVRAGETAGVLDQVMTSLADFADRELDMREQVRSAATYPCIVLALALVSIVVIMWLILPRIMATLGDAAALPLPTVMLMAGSEMLRAWGWLAALGLAMAAVGMHRWVNTPAGRLTFDGWKLRVPVLGPALRRIALARFARALGTLSKSGIQIVEALHVLRDTLGNEAMGQCVDAVRQGVTQGQAIAEPLRRSGHFPPVFIQVVALGERTGRLDELLLRAADAFDREATASIQRTMTVLPALFIVFLALLVGFILAAILLPLMNMSSAIPGA